MPATAFTRRRFVQLSVTSLLIGSAVPRSTRLRILVMIPSARTELLNGALFGGEEARRTAALMAGEVEITRHEHPDDLGDAIADDELAGIVIGHDAEALARASQPGTRRWTGTEPSS